MELKAEWVDFQKVPVCIIFPEIYLSLPAGFQTAYFKTIMSFLRCISPVYCLLCQRKKGGRRGGGREDERGGGVRQIDRGRDGLQDMATLFLPSPTPRGNRDCICTAQHCRHLGAETQ